MMSLEVLPLVVFVVHEITSIQAHHELPRPRRNKNHMRTFNFDPTLIPSRDPYDDNHHFRKHGKLYIIPLDSNKELDKLFLNYISENKDPTSLVPQNSKVSSYDPELPLTKSLPMLPTFDETYYKYVDRDLRLAEQKSDSEAPFDKEIIYMTKQKKNEHDLVKNLVRLLRNNGIYVTKPEMGKENDLQSLHGRSSKLQELNYERKKRRRPTPQVYKFSDLVL